MNAFAWGIGNGLVSTALIIYLVRDLCRGESNAAIGRTIALIVAAPRLMGVLRLLTRSLIDRSRNRKFFCICCFCIAPLILLAIPFLVPAMMGRRDMFEPSFFENRSSINAILALLAGVWCLYHLFEYFGTVALWSWIGDVVSPKIRGRFLGLREASMIAGQLLGFLAAGVSVPRMTYSEPAFVGR